tara:strand:- start:6770 stop:7804 length:1035 start_codon:yes stop_codon:yes gene_type:complete
MSAADAAEHKARGEGTAMVTDAAAAAMVFGSDSSEEDAENPLDVAGTLQNNKRAHSVAFESDDEDDEAGPSSTAETLKARSPASGPEHGRGLLSEMVHAALGEPASAATAKTAAISARSGWPARARKFSNLYGVVGDDGSPIVPENAYQCARWSSQFKTIVDWWMDLPSKPPSKPGSDEAAPANPQSTPTNKRYALAQLKSPDRPVANAFWDGVDGIFAKMLTTALTKWEDGVRVLQKGDVAKKRVVERWCEELSIPMPTPLPSNSERLQAVMRDAVRAKLTSSAFQDMLRPHLVGPDRKLPFWVAEKAPNEKRGGANIWTLPTGFPPEQIVPKEEKSKRPRRK